MSNSQGLPRYCVESLGTIGIKVLDLDKVPDIDDAVKEISLLCQLRSEYIISYYDSVIENTNLWIVMEYAAVGSVKDLIKTEKLGERVASVVTHSVLRALSYLHDTAKIIHRDIKAANILVTEWGDIKVCDFGVSKSYSKKSKRSSFIGTPHWMAPEVISREDHNFKADIWSLGITVIEILTGFPPSVEGGIKEHIYRLSMGRVPSLTGPYSDCTKSFVEMCLQFDHQKVRLVSRLGLLYPLYSQHSQRPEARNLLESPFIKNFSRDKTQFLEICSRNLRKRESEVNTTPSVVGNPLDDKPQAHQSSFWTFGSTAGCYSPVKRKPCGVNDQDAYPSREPREPLKGTSARHRRTCAVASCEPGAAPSHSQGVRGLPAPANEYSSPQHPSNKEDTVRDGCSSDVGSLQISNASKYLDSIDTESLSDPKYIRVQLIKQLDECIQLLRTTINTIP